MKINLSDLLYGRKTSIKVNDIIKFDVSYYKNTDIKNLSDISVDGKITKDTNDNILLELNVVGTMTLPSAKTLSLVEYPFNIEINEIIDSDVKKNDDYLKIINNILDIMPIIWQNIVVEIPLRVENPAEENIKLEGEGWKLLSEEEKMMELDSRLDKLRNLLDD